MFKTLVTIIRGASASAEQDFADRNALLLLDQQIRDATNALEHAKKALALAIAQNRQEEARVAAAETQIAELEARVTAALQAGAEALARDGAEAIARLEVDRNAYRAAKAVFEPEIQRQRDYVAQAQQRLLDVERGRRIARAGESIRVMRRGGVEEEGPHRATLADAEATLSRLRDRQAEIRIADEALDELETARSPDAIAQKLAAEGFGPRVKATADDVLSRLRARIQSGSGTAASQQS
jgi:phage shock protein A